jgi:oligopeptide transport system substrate-binding protein
MKAKKGLVIVLSAMLLLTATAGNGVTLAKTSKTAQTKIDANQYLNIVMSAEPSTLDPSKGSDSYSNEILNNILEPLTRLEESGNSNVIKPAAAKSWTKNANGTVWTFNLRDLKWSDGVPVKAQDYEYSIKRTMTPATASPYAYLLNPIKNAVKVNSGKLPVTQLGVKAIDAKTLQITLEAPTPYFMELTYQRVMFPQRKDLVEKYGAKFGSEMSTVVFNGPFKLTKWVHNSELVLSKNPSYWDNKTVKLSKVNYKIITDENAIYNSLQNGSIDSTSVGKPEWISKFKSNKNLTYFQVVNPSTFFQFFNTKDKLFGNANVRKAFSLAINRQELSKVIFHDINVPAYGWVPPNIFLGGKQYRTIVPEPLKQLAKDNPNAKALLIKGLTELKMDTDPAKLNVRITLGSTGQWFRTYGDYIQQMYNEALGINMKVELVEWPVFSNQVAKGDFQIGYMSWGADYNEPSAMLSLFKSDAGAIETGWKSDKYDQLIMLASKEMNATRRLAYYKQAEQILLYDESVVAPTVYPKSDVFRYSFVKGLGVTPFGTAGFKYAYTQGRK